MQQFASDLWLMEQSAMRQFSALASGSISVDAEQARAVSQQSARRQKNVAILPIVGVLEARPTMIGSLFGMSYERIGQAFDSLIADDSISGVILDVVSPGGMVYGAPELAEKIYSARGTKPIVAVANPMAASGAYWLAAAADRVIVTPSGDVGSVGVIMEHVDHSKALEDGGEKVTVIRSSGAPHKAEANGLEPLSDEARQHLQSRADAIHHTFVSALARYRGVSVDHVSEHFGKGRLVSAKQAVAAGMADRVMAMDELIGRMASGRIRLGGASAQDEWNAPTQHEQRLERMQRVLALASPGEAGE